MAISDRIAIMDGGLIAQVGSAEELYLRPASRFVAGFLGSANLLRGTVVAVAATMTSIDILGHRWELAANNPVAAGRPVDAVIRPEALTLAKEGAGPRGRVESRTYYGDKAEYLVRVGTDLVQAVQWNPSADDAFSEGDLVCVKLPASNVQLLAVD
jgi:ABC-type Fe3+/spermidine/putrescine transport system ATPase subunit